VPYTSRRPTTRSSDELGSQPELTGYASGKKRWADLLEHTRELAEERGIGPEDVEALVDEVRRDRA
jgi:hypothetical protein